MKKEITIAKGARKASGPFARIEDAVEAIRAGEMIIVVDDEDRENEGDLTIAAEKVTPEAINFMARYGRGLICLSMTPERLDELEIPLMVSQNTSRFETGFCVLDRGEGPDDDRHLGRRSGGNRAGRDRSGDQAVRSGAARPHVPAALADRRRDGARRTDRGGGRSGADRRPVSRRRHLRNHERGRHDGARAGAGEVREEARPADDHHRGSDQVPDPHRVAGEARGVGEAADRVRRLPHPRVREPARQHEHVALVRGDISDGKDVLVRVHSSCLTGDVLHSIRCDCGAQLDAAMQRIAAEGRGVLLYLNQEGRGIGLANKIRAYELQDEGFDTVEANERLGFKADQRDYGMGVQILRELGVRSMRLLSNNPRKLVGIEGYGLSVSEWLPLEIPASDSTRRYLKTKKEKLGHKLTSV